MTAPVSANPALRAGAGALGLFVLTAGFTAAWLALNSWLAEFQIDSRAVSRPVIHAAILYGLWIGLSRAGFELNLRVRIWLAIAIPFTVWLAAIWTLALDGAFEARPGGLPRIPLAILLPLIIFLPILLTSRRIGAILDATPPAWLVGLQLYRVFGGIFLVAWAQGRLAGVFAVPAGIGDVMTGLLALPIAYYLAWGGRGGRGAVIAWNIFGILDLVDAIAIGTLSAPGPLQLIVPDGPPIGAGTYPLVMVPAFAVPSSILLHALSLRQLRRLGRERRDYSAAARLAPAGAVAGVREAAQ